MRSWLIAIGVVFAVPATALADGEQYAWSISASSTDPFVQTGDPLPSPFSLHLWFVCHEEDGIAAAEFDAVASGDLFIASFSPSSPQVINLGSMTNLLLAIGGCPVPPFLAGTLLVFDFGAGGSVCLGPSAMSGQNVSVDCGFPQPTAFPNGVLGYSSDGSAPCVLGDCTDVAVSAGDGVESSTWGRVKGTYR